MDNFLHQTMANLATICEAQFIKRVVFSPGSRSAPLALAFLRNKNFEHYHLVDERSAAYFALGLAKKDLIPTILICTSGTAVLNYAPAIAEAYFQQIPLLVLTADRPPELVDQNDNQAIFQEGVFGKHVLKSFQMPVDYGHTSNQAFAQKLMNQAILASVGKRLGPVHVNFPFREPFYPNGDNVTPSENIMVLDYEPSPLQPQFHDEHFLPELINGAKNIWVFGGQSHENFTPHLKHLINDFCQRTGAIFFADPLTSLHVNQQVYHYDAWLKTKEVQPPDLVISYGNHFVSKQLKQFMKRNQQVQHVHLQSHEGLADPFFSINYFVETYISSFFEAIQPWIIGKELEQNNKNLLLLDFKEQEELHSTTSLDEWNAVGKLLNQIPENSVLHLGNSSPIRYLLSWNFLLKDKNIEVQANRGTSGIDGCVSTAVGMAQADERKHTLIIGDLAMMYDRNGLWHKHIPSNLTIVVINNRGGGIFRKIEGPKNQPELEEYFVNAQPCDFENLAKMHSLNYLKLNAREINQDLLQTINAQSIIEIKM